MYRCTTGKGERLVVVVKGGRPPCSDALVLEGTADGGRGAREPGVGAVSWPLCCPFAQRNGGGRQSRCTVFLIALAADSKRASWWCGGWTVRKGTCRAGIGTGWGGLRQADIGRDRTDQPISLLIAGLSRGEHFGVHPLSSRHRRSSGTVDCAQRGSVAAWQGWYRHSSGFGLTAGEIQDPVSLGTRFK